MTDKLMKVVLEADFSGRILIRNNEKTLFDYSGGFADRTMKKLIGRDTLFGIASGTKFLTALALGKLIEEHKISLDTKAFSIFDPGKVSYDKEITLRQLLNHTSGMPDYLDESLFPDMDNIELTISNDRLISPKDYLPLFPDTPMVHTPGERFIYNNGAFVYLAIIIEELSGMSYKDYINHQLMKPLGIERSGVYSFAELPSDCAIGYIQDGKNWISNISKLPYQAGGDGGAWMSAEDMCVIWKSFLNGRILSSKLTEEFLTPYIIANKEREIYYGLGLWLQKIKEAYLPYIVGSDAGISFKSSYNSATNGYKFAVSNTSEGLFEIINEINQVEV
ncbi:MAG: serine hydrolase [Clostridia bacterium]|nr:serine hydrolase [Clostridia bacterium]